MVGNNMSGGGGGKPGKPNDSSILIGILIGGK
jgi:hypothetical protein